jgi:hypothetical protein
LSEPKRGPKRGFDRLRVWWLVFLMIFGEKQICTNSKIDHISRQIRQSVQFIFRPLCLIKGLCSDRRVHHFNHLVRHLVPYFIRVPSLLSVGWAFCVLK